MNDFLDEIERRLGSWRPSPASRDLRERIGRRLRRVRIRWPYSAAAAVALFALGWFCVRTWREIPLPPPHLAATNGGSRPLPRPTANVVSDDDRPLTLWDYQRAALSSDEDLGNLVLPRRAAASEGEPEPTIAGRLPSPLEESL
jgi:hypothetical protein